MNKISHIKEEEVDDLTEKKFCKWEQAWQELNTEEPD